MFSKISVFPPPALFVPGSNSNWKWSIWDIRFFYISSFIKIRSPIRKIPRFSCFPRISGSPSHSLQCHRIWSRFKMSSKVQDPFKYQISLRSDHPFVSYKYLIFSNFSELLPPPPNSTKENGPVRLCQSPILDLCVFFQKVYSVMYLVLTIIFTTKFHPDPSTLSVFQDFRSPQLPPMSPDPVGI